MGGTGRTEKASAFPPEPPYLRHDADNPGVDLYTASKMMGHADVRPTQIYAKIVDSKKIEAVDMVDRMFEQEKVNVKAILHFYQAENRPNTGCLYVYRSIFGLF